MMSNDCTSYQIKPYGNAVSRKIRWEAEEEYARWRINDPRYQYSTNRVVDYLIWKATEKDKLVNQDIRTWIGKVSEED